MGNSVAIDLLKTGAWPEWAVAPGIIITEGEPDFLTMSTHLKAEPTRAVFGIFSGSWSRALADRIPSGSLVSIWTDPDVAGDKYAQMIGRSLTARCTVRRAKVRK